MGSMVVLMIRPEAGKIYNEIVSEIDLYNHEDSFLISVRDKIFKSNEKAKELIRGFSDEEEFMKHYYVGNRQEIVDYIMNLNPTSVQTQRFQGADHYRTYMTFFWK